MNQINQTDFQECCFVLDGDVILDSPSFVMFEGESVTLTCRHRHHQLYDANFYRNGRLLYTDRYNPQLTISPLSASHQGSYKCNFNTPTTADSPESVLTVEGTVTYNHVVTGQLNVIFRATL